MTTTTQFEHYFEEIKILEKRPQDEDSTRLQIHALIDGKLGGLDENSPYFDFLKGELAFYNKKYQEALKHYLLAKSVPSYKFYCYRASAYLANEGKDLEKAKNFAKKALEVCSEDYLSATLLAELNAPARMDIPAKTKTGTAFAPVFATSTEDAMFSQSDTLVACGSANTATTKQLMQRLYNGSSTAPFVKPAALPNILTALQKRAVPVSMPKSIRPQLSSTATTDQVLTHSIETFHQKQERLIADYVHLLKTRIAPCDNSLYVLQGWPENYRDQSLPHLLTQEAYRTSGGFYIRWNGKGVVINPGKHFLEHFHRQGLHIRDIHYVIVTGEDPSTYSDIEEIYALNYQLNQGNTGLQVIHYYLSQKSHEVLARKLKPSFKQERNMLHSLGLFLDSPDVEKTVLNEDMVLNYFPASTSLANLGITLELRSRCRNTGDLQTTTVGYLSPAPWSPTLVNHLGHCDLLIAGFGHTNADDYGKRKYNDDCLGYFGSYSLMESVQPQLMLCSDFDGREGDIRLEVVKMLRQQSVAERPNDMRVTMVLPADSRLLLDLLTLQVQCSVTRANVHATQVSVIKTSESGGNLQYLSPHCYT